MNKSRWERLTEIAAQPFCADQPLEDILRREICRAIHGRHSYFHQKFKSKETAAVKAAWELLKDEDVIAPYVESVVFVRCGVTFWLQPFLRRGQ